MMQDSKKFFLKKRRRKVARVFTEEKVLVMFQLLEENSEEFKGLSYEELLEECSELADQFLKSGFNIPNRSIYDCVSSFIKAKVQEKKKKRRKRFCLFLFFRFFSKKT